MPGGWYVMLKNELAGVEVAADSGKALLYFHHQIDELAEQLELAALSSFFCPDRAGVEQYLREQGVTPDADALPAEEWFDAADGLVTVRGLLERLRGDHAEMPQPEKVIADLEEVERVLMLAELRDVRFHLGRKLPSLSG